MPQALHHGCWCAFKQLYCLDANDDSCVVFVFGLESFTCGKMQRMSIWKMVLATLKAMSGRMLNKVRENSWTAVESMSAPTARGAKPDTHALKLDCIASKSWFRSSCSNPPKYPMSFRYLDHHPPQQASKWFLPFLEKIILDGNLNHCRQNCDGILRKFSHVHRRSRRNTVRKIQSSVEKNRTMLTRCRLYLGEADSIMILEKRNGRSMDARQPTIPQTEWPT